MYQLVICSALFLSTYFVAISGQATYPIPNANVNACIAKLNTSKILDKCRNASLAKWSNDSRKEKEGTVRDFCCEIYDEIDCVKNATNVRCQPPNKGPTLIHQTNVIKYWNSTFCSSIQYHGNRCNSTSSNFTNVTKHNPTSSTFTNVTKPNSASSNSVF